jgi:hypothetical protein
VSEEFNQEQIDRLRAIGRWNFDIINECGYCAEKDKEILELKEEIQDLKKKLKKKND